MKFIILILLSTYIVACSGEIEKDQSLKKKMSVIEHPSENSMGPQTKITQEHISGNGETHISGGPPSSHISGQ